MPVYEDIENPDVVLTDVDVVFIEPSVFDEPEPPAFQFQDANVALLALVSPPPPEPFSVNPSLSILVKPSPEMSD